MGPIPTQAKACNLHESIFDKGLRKLLDSDRFSEIALPNFMKSVNDGLLNVRVGFSDGTLHGLSSIRRRGEGSLHVEESGRSRLTFHIAGGPLEAYYAAGIRAWFMRAALDLRARIQRFQASFTVKEPLIQQKVGEALVRELRKLAAETLGAVKLYAVASAERTVREEDSPATRAWKNGYNAVSSVLNLIEGGRSHRRYSNAYSRSTGRTTGQRLDPYRARRQRQIGVFEGCLKTLVVSTGFEPAALPDDLEAPTFSVGKLNDINGNVTGISNVSVHGASWTSVDDCGIRARFDLVFRDVRVSATASYRAFFVSKSVAFEMEIPEVEVILEVQEAEDALRVTTYDVTFTANVTVTSSVPGAVGSVVNFFGGLPNMTLGDGDLELLKSSSRTYVQRIADAIAGFIADPPPIPIAQKRGRPSAAFA
ncbi:hypothetical protein HPB50_019221 [Hyalomma asiaticum]|uniref:Uncharacterized protein n=1 Tax=Hyalomma asiaticum TaxID=266040 RepID=A0ACB7T038_HYAAI|nr:hypothetical protein HPB50_019221 [Hyalomma asiaticum]